MGTGKRNRGNRYSLSVIMSARYAIVYTGGSHRAVEGPGPTTPCSRHQRLPLREADPYSSLSEQTPSEALVSAPYQPKKLPLDIYGAADFRLCGAGVWAVTGRGRAVCLHVWNSRSAETASQRAAPRSQTWIAKCMDQFAPWIAKFMDCGFMDCAYWHTARSARRPRAPTVAVSTARASPRRWRRGATSV